MRTNDVTNDEEYFKKIDDSNTNQLYFQKYRKNLSYGMNTCISQKSEAPNEFKDVK